MLFLFHYLKFLSGSGVNCLQTGPSSSGAPNRPLPPTPDEEESGDRTLVMKRVSTRSHVFCCLLGYKVMFHMSFWFFCC